MGLDSNGIAFGDFAKIRQMADDAAERELAGKVSKRVTSTLKPVVSEKSREVLREESKAKPALTSQQKTVTQATTKPAVKEVSAVAQPVVTQLKPEAGTAAKSLSETRIETKANKLTSSEKTTQRKPLPKRKPAVNSSERRLKAKVAQVKIPRDLMDKVESRMATAPGWGALSNSDKVAVALTVGLGLDPDALSEAAYEVFAECEATDPVKGLTDRLEALEGRVASGGRYAELAYFAASYLIFDRLGFRKSSSIDPRSVELLEPGVEDMLARVRECQATLDKKTRERSFAGRTKSGF